MILSQKSWVSSVAESSKAFFFCNITFVLLPPNSRCLVLGPCWQLSLPGGLKRTNPTEAIAKSAGNVGNSWVHMARPK